MTKDDSRALWENVKVNSERLRACAGPHDFEDITPEKTIGKTHRCRECQGEVHGTDFYWYRDGLAHGRAEAAAKIAKLEATIAALRRPGHTPRACDAITEEDRAAINLGSVIEALLEGPCTVDDLCGLWPDTQGDALKTHIALLQTAGVICPAGRDEWELDDDAETAARWEGCLPYARRLLLAGSAS